MTRRPRPLALLLLGLAFSAAEAAAPTIEVIADGHPQRHALLERAARPWRICALLPQGRDKFWWGVSWGLADQAQRLGVELGIYIAETYTDLAGQKRHWAECRARGAEAYLVAAVSPGGLNEEIASAMAEGRPVIDLINGLGAAVSSRSISDSRALGAMAADYLLRDAGPRKVSAAWFAGPPDAEWANEAERGFLERLRGRPVEVRLGGRGSTDLQNQSTLVRAHLAQAGAPDYLVGNAVAVEFAARLVARRPPPRPRLIAYYATEEMLARIASGEVLAAPTNQPVVQARIGLDLAVRALQGLPVPQKISVAALMIDRSNLAQLDRSVLMAPAGERLLHRPLPAASAAAAAPLSPR
ncbi:TMAO reductase system periplasmic protein TorT [Roseateles violae]|uniref:TMAO reductase system periplasmic protein TorT n=1 Tax=Roseateles violae TaxID=3058042 RepID=A0ABT8DUW1_9BURK|nr:TMAO reductase system periplasmic protein TorT [Pelomonas sp. PFR6]MDN3919951.1 TMAO reductase system periplasmic protein TorT [Pelomonas sp. PFR6]